MNTRLTHDPTKINPKFEGYKLQPCVEISSISRINLCDSGIQPSGKSSNDHGRLGFRDLQARVRQNHLFYGYPLDKNRSSSFIIDKAYQLYMILYNKQTKSSELHYISQLIIPMGSVPSYSEPSKEVPIEPQSCSVVAVRHDLLLVSNGVGDIELIGMEEKDGKILGISLGFACYMGTGDEGIQPVPCYILAARQIKNKIVLVVYSRAASKNTEFHVTTLEMDIPTDNTTERTEEGAFILQLHTLHIQTGPEVPVYCAITAKKHCIFASETKYKPDHVIEDQEEKTMDIDMPEKEPSYKWSQDGQDITIWFQLPNDTPKSAINCKFVHDHLSLIVKNTPIAFIFSKLWSTIRVDECVWTLEKDTLTLFLTKSDENTRWPQLFDKDDRVSETLSFSELTNINKSLAKFTSDDSQQFLKAAQHPAATDMDEELDESGQPIFFSVYDVQGNMAQEFFSEAYHWIGQSFTGPSLGSVCLGLDVDGLVFGLSEQDGIQISHRATFDAFSFVQASKRDARYILHHPEFHFTCVIESTRNIYIYFHHDDKRAIEAQTLVDLTLGNDIDVIGAQLVTNDAVMILTEAQIITIQLK